MRKKALLRWSVREENGDVLDQSKAESFVEDENGLYMTMKAGYQPIKVSDKEGVYYRGYTMSDWTFAYTTVRYGFLFFY